MSATAVRRHAPSTDSNVLPFPHRFFGSSETEAFTQTLEAPQELFERLRAAFDAYMADTFVRQLQGTSARVDSPFDAVYISALEPDELEESPTAVLKLHADVVDLSDSLQFNDVWGD